VTPNVGELWPKNAFKRLYRHNIKFKSQKWPYLVHTAATPKYFVSGISFLDPVLGGISIFPRARALRNKVKAVGVLFWIFIRKIWIFIGKMTKNSKWPYSRQNAFLGQTVAEKHVVELIHTH